MQKICGLVRTIEAKNITLSAFLGRFILVNDFFAPLRFTCNRYHTKQIQSTVNFQRTTHGSRALMASRALMTTTNLISIKHKREKATIKSNDLRKS